LKLELYILRELVVAFAFAVGGMLVLALPGVAVSATHRLAGVDAMSVLFFLPLLLAGLVPYILPIGFLLAVVVTYGRLAADREWTAIRMAGIHPIVAVRPALLVAVVLSAGTWRLVGEELPDLRRRERTYIGTVLRETITNLSPGRTAFHIGKFYLSSGYREGRDFLEAFIHIPARAGEEAQSFLAERVRFQFEDDYMLVHLRNARSVVGDLDVKLAEPVIRLALDDVGRPSGQTRFSSMRYQRSSALNAALAGAELEPERRPQFAYEVHSRAAISTTYLMFLLLGIPTGLLLRRGTQLAALSVAVGFALVYYVLSMRLGKQLAEMGWVSPTLGAWSVNLLGVAVGAAMMRKALRQ